MVKRCRGPGCSGLVAGIALGGGADVGGRLGLCVLRQEGTVMAFGTESSQPGVIHAGRCPGHKTIGMAGIALPWIGNMSDRPG